MPHQRSRPQITKAIMELFARSCARSCLLVILAVGLPGRVDGQCGGTEDGPVDLPTATGAPGAFKCSSCWVGGGRSSWLVACSASTPCVGGNGLGTLSECLANANRINTLTSAAGRTTNFQCNLELGVSHPRPPLPESANIRRRIFLRMTRISASPSAPAQAPRTLQ